MNWRESLVKKSEMEFTAIRALYDLLTTIVQLGNTNTAFEMYRIHDQNISDTIKRHSRWSRLSRMEEFADLLERDFNDPRYIYNRMNKQLRCLEELKSLDKKRKSFW